MYDIGEVIFLNNELFSQILKQTQNQSYLKSEDIPALDLYMDQIMTLFDIHLSDNKRYETDKLLTKTMINNYSKEGLLKPIKGKKYSKEHILQMLMIYSLKNTISIQEIKKVLQPYHDKTEAIEPLYNDFLNTREDLLNIVTTSLQEFVVKKEMDLNQQDQMTMLLLLICTLSNQYKIIAEKMLDTFYIEEEKK